MPTKRKPYIRPVQASWWQENPFYRFYMLREGTAIGAVWISILILYAVYALRQGESAWNSYVLFLSDPLVMTLNVIALGLACLHTKTWFDLAPKAANGTEKQGKMMKCALWGATLLASVAVLGLFLRSVIGS